ncbi:metallophosphoesterase [Blastococcus sp. TF02-8]|uniref:metallophosphoesterase family protein n=1 Tax=Blastococcus sp. TF02-8 TaxID=2250574 RepID=UPI001F0CD204|nr:metallophosphoesterase [Blastococcus sp. TF02-8]
MQPSGHRNGEGQRDAEQDAARPGTLPPDGTVAARVARRAAAALSVVLAGLVRWMLRLALPLAGAAALLHSFPYRATVQGVPFRVEGSLLTRPGLSAETTLGSWVFPDLSGLPVGVRITPSDVDVLDLARAAGEDRAGFAQRLQADAAEQFPRIAAWLVAEVVLGVALGLLAAAAINMSLRYLRGRPRRPDELQHRMRQLGSALAVVMAVALYGWVTYNPDWARQSRLTGTLAAAQLFPGQLADYYTQQSKVSDVLGSIVGLQASLQQQIDEDRAAGTALQIMFISDMHLAANYPLVQAYAESYDVDLIVNTGDESEFGTSIELTSTYLDAMRAVTADTPMLWIAGNHDSPDTADVMRTIPGVTVLGGKQSTADGFAVTAGMVRAFGLTVAGVSDPRTYGGPGAYGSDDGSVTGPLQRSATADALANVTGENERDRPFLDIFAAHGSVMAGEARELLGDRIRQTNTGHVHAQNEPADVQSDAGIDLVEGSTGAGGLDNIVRGAARPPVAFTIESVAEDCQFTRVIRFQIRSIRPEETSRAEAADPQGFGSDVAASTIYLQPQDIAEGRSCGTELGIGEAEPL